MLSCYLTSYRAPVLEGYLKNCSPKPALLYILKPIIKIQFSSLISLSEWKTVEEPIRFASCK